MEEYCVDLEIAKELKKNGFPQKGFFWWHCYKTPDFCMKQNNIQFRPNKLSPEDSGLAIDYSAPTSDEILKELPVFIDTDEGRYFLAIDRLSYSDKSKQPLFISGYRNITGSSLNHPDNICSEEDTLSNCLGFLWLLLKKEDYIE